ncbi:MULTISPECIES: nucleotide exchange factor GrpE [Acutalibacteraceae]|uniref:nucleotide exchange factor GrpE n=1 Tax=Acutalibacteraceae TaxID=3082771 RepID=UPI0013E8B5B9|nr:MULTISPECIES: nucleotide exchange factor GrpE [Acutalibacteraceae]
MEEKEKKEKTQAEDLEKGPEAAEEPTPEKEKSSEQAAPREETKEDAAANAEAELQRKLEEANRQVEKQKDLLLRTAAEYDNYRKRTAREKASLYNDATAAAVQEILTVADSLDRALEQKECTAEDMRRGVELVQKQMQSALDKLGVKEMGKEGEPFDPELHNAISHVEDPKSGENSVVKVFQKGYQIGGRVIRHAMVQVAN